MNARRGNTMLVSLLMVVSLVALCSARGQDKIGAVTPAETLSPAVSSPSPEGSIPGQPAALQAANEWTWIAGNGRKGQVGVYGTKGVAAAANTPGARECAMTWTDSSGKLWLFGGYWEGVGPFNDLWVFDPATMNWTWMGGNQTVNGSGVYGTQGKESSTNLPGARCGGTVWTTRGGLVFLFGGDGLDAYGNWGSLGDLWVFNPNNHYWTFVSGYDTVNIYDYRLPYPGAHGAGWVDLSGRLWQFGGSYQSTIDSSDILWEYDTDFMKWYSIMGPDCDNCAGSYGTLGVPRSGNMPGSRFGSATWTDNQEQLWLFGGFGFDAYQNYGLMNDLWVFNTSSKLWTWMGGPAFAGQSGTYGTLKTPSADNIPGARENSLSWTDKEGRFWLMGGNGLDANGDQQDLNDLWIFDPAAQTWTWMGGASVGTGPGTYGAKLHAGANLKPGGRDSAARWLDNQGNLWVFGGYGIDYGGDRGYMNDLWLYSILPAATPVFTPAGGTYTKPQTVKITAATPGAAIYYTLDGSTPTAGSSLYSGPVPIGTTQTLKALAVAPGSYSGTVGSATYTINLPTVATPGFSPAAGTYTTIQTVRIGDATPGAAIYYTTNGSTPTTASAKYTGPLTVAATLTIRAMAAEANYTNSAIAAAGYTIHLPTAATPVFTPAAGRYGAGQVVSISDATPGATLYVTTDGSVPTSASSQYVGPITVTGTETLKAMASAYGILPSAVLAAAYTIAGSPAALIEPATGLTPTSATLQATVTTGGLAGSYVFKYGKSKTALTSSTASTALPASASPTASTIVLNGLQSKTVYYYQIVVTTIGGTGTSSVLSFTTQ